MGTSGDVLDALLFLLNSFWVVTKQSDPCNRYWSFWKTKPVQRRKRRLKGLEKPTHRKFTNRLPCT